MKILYVLFSYNRPKMFAKSWHTLMNNSKLKPNRILITDDGSIPEVKQFIFNEQLNNKITIDLFSTGKNIGYGNIAEYAFKMIELYNPNFCFILENDYIYAKNGLDIIMDLFENNEYAKNALGFAGYDSPDYYSQDKIKNTYPEIIKNEFGEDNLNRDILYKPFEQKTKFGNIKLEFVSNSCSTSYWNWQKIMDLKEEFPIEFERVMYRVFDKHKNGTGKPKYINDGALSHGMSWLWNKWAIKNNIDRNKYAALLNIKPSIANHINGGPKQGPNGEPGVISGYIVPEGETFVSSPSFNWNNY